MNSYKDLKNKGVYQFCEDEELEYSEIERKVREF